MEAGPLPVMWLMLMTCSSRVQSGDSVRLPAVSSERRISFRKNQRRYGWSQCRRARALEQNNTLDGAGRSKAKLDGGRDAADLGLGVADLAEIKPHGAHSRRRC
jgi:hypothetical protein